MSYYNISQYYQNTVESIGSKDDFVAESIVEYDNTVGLYPLCDILLEFTSNATSGPEKKIRLHKFCYMGSFNINNYKNVVNSNQYQGTFIDGNASNENFPLDSSFKLYDFAESQYYVFSKIFLPPCKIAFFFSFDSGVDFNTYLIPYTLGI